MGKDKIIAGLHTMLLILKGKKLPIGHVSTRKDGSKWTKTSHKEWKMVKGPTVKKKSAPKKAKASKEKTKSQKEVVPLPTPNEHANPVTQKEDSIVEAVKANKKKKPAIKSAKPKALDSKTEQVDPTKKPLTGKEIKAQLKDLKAKLGTSKRNYGRGTTYTWVNSVGGEQLSAIDPFPKSLGKITGEDLISLIKISGDANKEIFKRHISPELADFIFKPKDVQMSNGGGNLDEAKTEVTEVTNPNALSESMMGNDNAKKDIQDFSDFIPPKPKPLEDVPYGYKEIKNSDDGVGGMKTVIDRSDVFKNAKFFIQSRSEGQFRITDGNGSGSEWDNSNYTITAWTKNRDFPGKMSDPKAGEIWGVKIKSPDLSVLSSGGRGAIIPLIPTHEQLIKNALVVMKLNGAKTAIIRGSITKEEKDAYYSLEKQGFIKYLRIAPSQTQEYELSDTLIGKTSKDQERPALTYEENVDVLRNKYEEERKGGRPSKIPIMVDIRLGYVPHLDRDVKEGKYSKETVREVFADLKEAAKNDPEKLKAITNSENSMDSLKKTLADQGNVEGFVVPIPKPTIPTPTPKPFTLEQESIPETNEFKEGNNLFGIKPQNEKNFISNNYKPKWTMYDLDTIPGNPNFKVANFINSIKNKLLNEGLDSKAREWVDRAYKDQPIKDLVKESLNFIQNDELLNFVSKDEEKTSDVDYQNIQLQTPDLRKEREINTYKEIGTGKEIPKMQWNQTSESAFLGRKTGKLYYLGYAYPSSKIARQFTSDDTKGFYYVGIGHSLDKRVYLAPNKKSKPEIIGIGDDKGVKKKDALEFVARLSLEEN